MTNSFSHFPELVQATNHLLYRQPYIYLPLDEEKKEIRLLTLLPGAFSSSICINLKNAVLDPENLPAYEALSYAWGDVDAVSKIGVGVDAVLSITKSLAVALRHLRYLDIPRDLWIDAICIDQQNIKERGHQVKHMGDVYSLANRVVVWLGPREEKSNYALRLMETLASKVDINWLTSTMKPSVQSKDEPEWADRDLPLPYQREEYSAIYALIRRQWFERLWVRQEIRLANRESIVMCGTNIISWLRFRDAIFCLLRKEKDMEVELLYPFEDLLETIYNISYDSTAVPFVELLYNARACKCSDPKDRVFAILSMLPTFEKHISIQPDYSLSTLDIYQNVVLRHVKDIGRLDILQHCEMQDLNPAFPTWVPDWSVVNFAAPLLNGSINATSVASGQAVKNGTLSVAGVCVDTLNMVEELLLESFSSQEVIAKLTRLAPPDIETAQYAGGGSLLDAYCSTMVCGKFADSSVPHAAWLPKFQEAREALLSFLQPNGHFTANLSKSSSGSKYLDVLRSFWGWRCFFTTNNGYIGLAPKSAKVSDRVCVVLGCDATLLLRPTGDSQYQVVGECYTHRCMNGEALLGPIPHPYSPVRLFDEGSRSRYATFMNTETGETEDNDPRLKRYLETAGTSVDPELQSRIQSNSGLTAEDFRSLGIDIQNFELV